ncbi:MAG: peptidase S11 [Gammaproteobacteria bacterium]|jgi:D-alanyl-D-alanine endopeptidase (penicillin-binding protein 7)|nr:peptidase S11 [Gammaproteobacteria bacterium]
MSSRYCLLFTVALIAFASLGVPPASAASLEIRSGVALIIDHEGNRLFERNPNEVRPIASITKLMTAMVVIDADVPLDDRITITEADRDRLRWSRSRLRIGEARLSRLDLLRTALISSDNRAAAALGRTTFAGGTEAFVEAMNEKARALGMHDTNFADASGLNAANQSTAEDLVRLVNAAAQYPLIREITSTEETEVEPHAHRGPLPYRNTNPLTRDERWKVELSKTGYLNEAGRCLVMQAVVENRRIYAIFLNAQGQLTPIGDANRFRRWLQETDELKPMNLSARGG